MQTLARQSRGGAPNARALRVQHVVYLLWCGGADRERDAGPAVGQHLLQKRQPNLDRVLRSMEWSLTTRGLSRSLSSANSSSVEDADICGGENCPGAGAQPLRWYQDAEDVLVAVAPIVGAPRAASAAVKIAEALDLAISFAIEESQ